MPQVEKLVTDGRTVWWYMPDENLVHLYKNVDVYGEMKPLLDFLGGLSKLDKTFKVKVIPAGSGEDDRHQLELNKLKEGSGPSGITVWFHPKSYDLAGFRLTSLTGETTDFTLENAKINPKLEDRVFVFDIPRGAQVVEESGD